MSTDAETRKRRVLDILNKMDSTRPKSRAPTDDQIFSAIIGSEVTVTDEDLRAMRDSTDADDYDEWIAAALHDRKVGRCQMDAEGEAIQHPTARVFRLGIESIEAGKPSALFIALLREVASGADRCAFDVLNQMFPRECPPIDNVQLSAALKKEQVVREFRKKCKAERGRMSFKELKAGFKLKQQLNGRFATGESVDRILTEFGLGYKAKRGPVKKPRNKGDVPTVWKGWGSF